MAESLAVYWHRLPQAMPQPSADPAADWAALHHQLSTIIEQTRIDVEFGDDGEVENLKMDVTNQPGNVEMKVKGGDRAKISGLSVAGWSPTNPIQARHSAALIVVQQYRLALRAVHVVASQSERLRRHC